MTESWNGPGQDPSGQDPAGQAPARQAPAWSAGAAPDVLASRDGSSSTVRRALMGVAAAVAAVGVAGTAWAAASFLSGGGPQPEDVLPAGTVAMAKVDLDPAAGQKVAIFRLAQRFPSTREEVSSADDVRDELLRALLADAPDLDYDRDVEPWVGDRAAAALVAVPGEEPQPLAAIAFTDRAEADAALRRLTADDPEAHYAFSEQADFVLVGPSQQVVDDAAGTSDVLAGSARFQGDVEELDGDQVVTGWADLDALWRALPEQDRAQAAADQLAPTGRVVVGGRAMSDGVEVVGRSFGAGTGAPGSAAIGAARGTGMVAGLPADTVAALSVTGLGEGLAGLYEQVTGGQDALGLAATAEATGLDLPADLRVLYGEETLAAAFSEQDLAARSRTSDPDRALAVVEVLVATVLGFGAYGEELSSEGFESYEQELAPFGEGGFDPYAEDGFDPDAEPGVDPYGEDGFGPGTEPGTDPYGEEGFDEQWWDEEEPLEGEPTYGAVARNLSELPAEQLRRLDDGIAVGTTGAAVDKIASGDGGLGRSPVFRRAVPDAAGAGIVLFVDLARAAALSGDPVDDDVRALEAVGVTVTGGPDAVLRLRLTVR